jgi:hypothetical protein
LPPWPASADVSGLATAADFFPPGQFDHFAARRIRRIRLLRGS